ncbi:DUF4394 domain-containing protein [Massilia sp. SYSU DXS3249]
MRKLVKTVVAASLVLATLPAIAADNDSRDRSRSGCESGDGRRGSNSLSVVGLTEDMRLVCFNEKRPGKADSIGIISGLVRGDALVGIDFRVQDGKLYGVSRTGGVYVIDTRSAMATKVSQLSVALEGASFGVDFNPAADRLRVVSDSGQNLRHNVNAAGVTIVDDPLDYPPATPVNAVGANATFVTGSAYTNNDLSPSTATTLYALDTTLDQVALQSPPNDGTLAATGKLELDAAPAVGFDIYSTVRGGVAVSQQALASLRTGEGDSKLFSINLSTGKATSRGSFPSQYRVIGIAIPLNQL